MADQQTEKPSCATCRYCQGGQDYPASAAVCAKGVFIMMRDPKTISCQKFERSAHD